MRQVKLFVSSGSNPAVPSDLWAKITGKPQPTPSTSLQGVERGLSLHEWAVLGQLHHLCERFPELSITQEPASGHAQCWLVTSVIPPEKSAIYDMRTAYTLPSLLDHAKELALQAIKVRNPDAPQSWIEDAFERRFTALPFAQPAQTSVSPLPEYAQLPAHLSQGASPVLDSYARERAMTAQEKARQTDQQTKETLALAHKLAELYPYIKISEHDACWEIKGPGLWLTATTADDLFDAVQECAGRLERERYPENSTAFIRALLDKAVQRAQESLQQETQQEPDSEETLTLIDQAFKLAGLYENIHVVTRGAHQWYVTVYTTNTVYPHIPACDWEVETPEALLNAIRDAAEMLEQIEHPDEASFRCSDRVTYKLHVITGEMTEEEAQEALQ